MLRLRSEQMTALGKVVQDEFERRVIVHLRESLPELTADLSDDDLRPRLQRGWKRAEKHGLESQRQAVCYIDTCFLLGDDFEQNPRHAWAVDLLASEDIAASDKADKLLERAENHYGAHGPSGGRRDG